MNDEKWKKTVTKYAVSGSTTGNEKFGEHRSAAITLQSRPKGKQPFQKALQSAQQLLPWESNQK